MSKLDGNERWKSKMLLTEHQEQYEKRKEPKHTGRPTPEELTLMRDAIILPHMITMSIKAYEEEERSKNLFKRYSMRMIQMIIERMEFDRARIKRELRQRDIKLTENETKDNIVYHTYYCRGYTDRFGIVRETLRSEISVRIAKYGAEFFKPLT